jgi:hypothetical protein
LREQRLDRLRLCDEGVAAVQLSFSLSSASADVRVGRKPFTAFFFWNSLLVNHLTKATAASLFGDTFGNGQSFRQAETAGFAAFRRHQDRFHLAGDLRLLGVVHLAETAGLAGDHDAGEPCENMLSLIWLSFRPVDAGSTRPSFRSISSKASAL